MSVAFPLVILFDVVVFVNFVFWQQDAYLDIRQRQLDLQVNYSVDAAVTDMLDRGTHIDTDYADWGSMKVEPELALDTYQAVLLRNFGWADSEQNRKYLEDYSMPVFVVAAYDGYYIYSAQKNLSTIHYPMGNVQSITFDHIWTPKLPYAEYYSIGTDAYLHSDSYKLYNLGQKYYTVVRGNSIEDLHEMTDAEKDEQRRVVTDSLIYALNSSLYLGTYGAIDKTFYLPVSFSQWADNNPVESVSVLTYIVDPLVAQTKDKRNISTFAIAGAKIDEPLYCILYKNEAGILSYTYEKNRSLVEKPVSQGGRGLTISAIVTSPLEAARRGYYYDTAYLNVQ